MRWLRRFSDAGLSRENERLREDVQQLQEQLQTERSKVRIQDAEITELSAVIARNLKRVEAETAATFRGIPDEHR